MNKNIKLIIFAKSIDGGTGTFFEKIVTLNEYFPAEQLLIRPLVLEKPAYRQSHEKVNHYMRPAKYYPEKYAITVKSLRDFIDEIFWLRNHIKKFQPDIILSVDSHCNILALVNNSLFFNRTKIIITTHNYLEATFQKKASVILQKLLRFSISFLYNKAESIICVSSGICDELTNTFKVKKKVDVIYYGLKNIQSKNVKISRSKKKIFICIARLVEQKDHTTLLHAFHALLKEKVSAELWIVGDGPLKNDLLKLAKSLNIARNISFLGWRKDVYKLLQRADVFALSSHREGLPYAMLEALSAGLPIIATDTPFGPKEILDNGKYGILVPMRDEIALKNAMEKLLKNNNTYNFYANQAIKRSQFFTEEKMFQAYKKIILELI